MKTAGYSRSLRQENTKSLTLIINDYFLPSIATELILIPIVANNTLTYTIALSFECTWFKEKNNKKKKETEKYKKDKK